MINQTPFIHLIKTPLGHYFYDVNTNSIVSIEKDIYYFLEKQQQNTSEDIFFDDRITDTVLNMKQEGLLSIKRPTEMVHPNNNQFEYYLNNRVRKVTLQITQKCNFRCSYCIYSEAGNDKQRKHSLKSMSFEMAKECIDFLLRHSRDTEEFDIGFYGGEPLIEFELIKKCVKYAEEIFEGKKLTFSLTTNGSIFNNEIIEFLINHDFNILISLDGPKEIHDIQRRFASNGCGTFDAIEKNLVKIKENYREFFNKLSFNMVIDPANDFDCVNSIFVNYDLFKESQIRSTIIDDEYSDEKNFYSQDYLIKNNYEIFKAFLYHFKRIDKENVSPISLQEIKTIIDISDKLGHSNVLPDKTTHSGPCIPGVLRLFINTDGYFYPCERVSELSEVTKIGDIKSGFDIEKARDLLNICKLTSNSCKNCWAIRHCTLCAKHADNIKALSAGLKRTNCNYVKENVENLLRKYILFKEISAFYSQSIG